MQDNKVINIVKILNFPVESGLTEELEVNLNIDENVNIYCLSDNIGIIGLIDSKKLKYDKKYSCEGLFVIDDQGTQITLLGCSFWCKLKGFTKCIDFAFNGIFYGSHIKNIDSILLDKVELKANCEKALHFNFTNNGITVVSKPIYTKENYTIEELEWLGDEYPGKYTHTTDFILTGSSTFSKYDKLLWRLSEFTLLYKEYLFFYDTFVLYCKENQYKYKSFTRSNTENLRKNNLRTSKNNVKILCSIPFNDFEKLFENFMDFRDKSGIIFDVFRSTIYSQSFREDYPLRLSQTMEGLANYLNLANTNKNDSFNTAIQISLYCNDYIKEYLPKNSDIAEFAKNITKHRNKFSHVKDKGEYLKGTENERYAEILYTTIRVIIIKHIQEEL